MTPPRKDNRSVTPPRWSWQTHRDRQEIAPALGKGPRDTYWRVPGARRVDTGQATARRLSIWDAVSVAFAVAGLFYFSGSLVAPLTPEGAASSTAVQLLGLGFGFLSFLGLIVRPGAVTRAFTKAWPVLIPVALAMLSMTWSIDIGVSLRRVLALLFATLFGLWIVDRFPLHIVLPLIAWSAVLIVVANVVTSLALPSMGVHPGTTVQGEPNPHAGAWRGLFDHKNDFGRMMALCVSILWVATGPGQRWRRVRWGALALGYLGVAGSNSAQAALLAVAVPIFGHILFLLRPLSPSKRAMVVLMAGPVMVTGWVFYQFVFVFVLSLLGKDPTLTGRTEIWIGVLRALQGNMGLGGGFGAGWDLVGERLYILMGIRIGHAHNGFLDLMTDLGVVGLCVMLTFYVYLTVLSVHTSFGDRFQDLGRLGFAVATFALVGNGAASFLLLHNSIYWVLPVVCVAAMRRDNRRPTASRRAPPPRPVKNIFAS
ncbi:O-antigen ligase [Aliiruegeria haliotis]|uniref:O-antigen ligase n=1 Tax=Aliiruegeria haliotis TaxID=1280846 RepID=A0A2T0S085_9RHOB|nr:O-antigen ligase family protein [Aliiruegeria haliotis]PRY26825.1 O-antigen ligase [Aliiruegeria haliotis]